MQPPSPPKQKPTVHSWLKNEWNHLIEMDPLPLCLLGLPSILLLPLCPLLPPAAYALQQWAASSWAWRDRWTSVWSWAKQGVWFCAILAGFMILGRAHIWFFPELIVAIQAFWQAHLPGNLSLFPLDGHALFARTLLLLPLTPILALFYERIDPRTQVYHRRVLTPADLTKPPKKSPTPPPAPSKAPAANQTPPQTIAQEPHVPPQVVKTKRPTPPPAGQMTIESFLAPDQAQTATPQSPEKSNMQTESEKTTSETQVKPPVTEDWDDMAE
jgi:hypothetical protein